MKKVKFSSPRAFSDWTNSREEYDNALLVIARIGKGRVKSAIMVYSEFFKTLCICETPTMTYIRWGWIELNIPTKEAKSQLKFLDYRTKV